MASKLFKKNNELKFEDFEPTHELRESPENHVLLVNIPGFRKEDFKVQVDSSGKLSVKGQRIADNKCRRFNKIFQLPADSNIEKIRGKFEADVLTLTVSRKEKALLPNEEIKSSAEANPREEAKASDQEKEKESKPEENSSEKKEEESKGKEEPKQTTDNKEEEAKPEETETDKKIKEEPRADAKKKEELTKTKEETGSSTPETKKPASGITDATSTWKSQNNISDAKNDNPTMKNNPAGRKIVSWKERIRQEAKGWSDHATLDNILDVISRNKKEIAVAVAAISIGFMVVRRLNAGK